MFTLPFLLVHFGFSHPTSSFHIVVEFTVTAFAPTPSIASSSIVVGPLSSFPAFEGGFVSCFNYCIPFRG